MAPFDRSCTSSYLRSVIRFDPWSYLVSSATLGKILVEYRDSLKPPPAFDASECEGGGVGRWSYFSASRSPDACARTWRKNIDENLNPLSRLKATRTSQTSDGRNSDPMT